VRNRIEKGLRRQAGAVRSRVADARAGDLEPRLTWIWGSPRSGSSWLLRLLAYPLRPHMYKSLGFMPPYADATVPPQVLPVEELSFANHLAPWTNEVKEVYGKWLPATTINFSEGRPSYLLAKEYEGAWRPPMRSLLLERMRAVERRARGALPGMDPQPLIVLKETPASHGADRVMALFPESRALLLIRDPRDVVDSLMHAFARGGFMANAFGVSYDTEDERLEGVRWAARHWAMSFDVSEMALAAHDPARGRTVRYEDLRDDPEGELAGVLAWMGLERTPAQVAEAVAANSFERLPADQRGEGKRNRSAQPGRWRENLSASELDEVYAIVGERLERLGYER
jgi:hypothetical protein